MHKGAAVAALGVFAATVLAAVPAHACSCGRSQVEEALRTDRAVAIVTRTDDGDLRGKAATLTVEASVPMIAARMVADTSGEDCQPSIPPGAVTAVALDRKAPGVADPPGDWVLGGCSEMELGPVLLRALGKPVPERGGAPVAIATGWFGGARLAALDAAGKVVAYDGLDRRSDGASVCPKGKIVAAVGGLVDKYEHSAPPEVTVHDATTLRVLRRITLPVRPDEWVHALRCADPDGDRIEVPATEQDGSDTRFPAKLFTVTGWSVTSRTVGVLDQAEPTTDGLIAAGGGKGSVSLLHIGGDGSRRIVDAHSGATLAERNVGAVYTLALTGSDRLAIRGEGMSDGIRLVDRTLNELGTRTALPFFQFAAVGDVLVGMNLVRMTLSTPDGSTHVLPSLRLAAAANVIAFPGREFALGTGSVPGAAPNPADHTARRTFLTATRHSRSIRCEASRSCHRSQKRIAAGIERGGACPDWLGQGQGGAKSGRQPTGPPARA